MIYDRSCEKPCRSDILIEDDRIVEVAKKTDSPADEIVKRLMEDDLSVFMTDEVVQHLT